MESGRPQVFVSSTVYDFRDLRSALKLWLEEYGYDVLMSEFNDFPQLADKNSYESCLRAIDRSDYFVLLVGGRVGGWFDQATRVSITRMEYRHAYQRFKEGKLKLLVLVRKEIWDIREDRQALKKYLEDEAALDKELAPDAKAKLVGHPTKFLNDAEFVIDFIKEVGRVEEMKLATQKGATLPGGNWMYQFTSFRDVIDACRTVLNLSGNLRQKALRVNLQHEIRTNLAELLQPDDEGVKPITSWSSPARRCYQGGLDDSSSYKGDYLVWLGMSLLTSGGVGKKLGVTALQEAITSGEFLEFDKATGLHRVGLLQQAMLDLHGHVERLQATNSSELSAEGIMLLKDERVKMNRNASFSVPNQKFVMPFAVHDMIDNVLALSRAFHKALDGDEGPLGTLKLHPSSPLKDESEKIKKERPTNEAVESWLDG